MTLHEIFTANVRKRRRELHLTQWQLAERLQVSRPYVSQVESGDHTPTLELVEKFARAMDCPPLQLLIGAESSAAPHAVVAGVDLTASANLLHSGNAANDG
jgi:transcriptional regulator with XRE-family HTH domain